MSAQAASSFKKSPVPVIFGAELCAGAVGKLPHCLAKVVMPTTLQLSMAPSTPLIFVASSRSHVGHMGSALLLTTQRLCLRLRFLKYHITCSRTVRLKCCLQRFCQLVTNLPPPPPACLTRLHPVVA
jgi:hypothetical protein